MLNIIPEVKSVHFLEGDVLPLTDIQIHLKMKQSEGRINTLVAKAFPEANLQEAINDEYNGYYFMANTKDKNIPIDKLQKIKNKKEGYYLKIDDNGVVIFAYESIGLFYGIQTLRQLIDNHSTPPTVEIVDWPDVQIRCMNYDLRHTFSKPELLIKYLAEFAKFKANAILIEYEDKMPFKTYPFLNHEEYTFTEAEFEELKQAAHENFIELIPLQQVFGHLEYVLKHDQFKHLRETPDSIGELCPTNPESFELAKVLLTECIENHPNSTFIHLGCDEVYSLCTCDQCVQQNEGSRQKTFINYVNKLVDFVVSKGKVPIIWHDMMAKCSDEDIEMLDDRVIVMIWIYDGKDVETRVTNFTHLFRKHGNEVIGGPAVRCFDKTDDQNYPIAPKRISNLNQWTKTANKLDITGLVSTNWGTVFGMGVPYGIFETSWYLVGYSCDRYWNYAANKDTYLERFMRVFHGLEQQEWYDVPFDYVSLEDYYPIIAEVAERTKRNNDVAQLIKVMKEFEVPATYSRTIHKYIYRWTINQSEAERISLTKKYQTTTELLEEIRPKMEGALNKFLPTGMVDHYLKSRFYIYDVLDEELYQKSGLLDELPTNERSLN